MAYFLILDAQMYRLPTVANEAAPRTDLRLKCMRDSDFSQQPTANTDDNQRFLRLRKSDYSQSDFCSRSVL